MEIKKQDNSNCVLMKASCADENYDPVSMAYIELTKKELMNWLELREKLADLEQNGVRELTLGAGLWWVEDIPDELSELNEELPDAEHIEVTTIPEDFMNDNEMRVESSDAMLTTWGVGFKAILKHTNVEVSTWSFSWEFIIQALKNCDPQSVRFIKDEEEASTSTEAGDNKQQLNQT